jgi:hypothetical protein
LVLSMNGAHWRSAAKSFLKKKGEEKERVLRVLVKFVGELSASVRDDVNDGVFMEMTRGLSCRKRAGDLRLHASACYCADAWWRSRATRV